MLIKVLFFLYTYNEPLGVFGSLVLTWHQTIQQFTFNTLQVHDKHWNFIQQAIDVYFRCLNIKLYEHYKLETGLYTSIARSVWLTLLYKFILTSLHSPLLKLLYK